jgi:proline iminopeptidase
MTASNIPTSVTPRPCVKLGAEVGVTLDETVISRTYWVYRGIFTLRKAELQFFYQSGTSFLFPEAWCVHCRIDKGSLTYKSHNRDEYLAPIPEQERDNMIAAYHSRLNSETTQTRLEAARAWSKWE